jgi:hypothetical protein
MAPKGTECGELFVWSSGTKKHLGRRVQMRRAGRARARGTAPREGGRAGARSDKGAESRIAGPPARSALPALLGLRPGARGRWHAGRAGKQRTTTLDLGSFGPSTLGWEPRTRPPFCTARACFARTAPAERHGGVPFWPGSSPSGAVGRSCCRMPGCRRKLRHSPFEDASRMAGTERESGIPAPGGKDGPGRRGGGFRGSWLR